VGVADDMTGQALVAFVTLKGDRNPSKELNQELLEHVAKEIGKFARPKAIRFADAVPKTRSGKIMRRLLRDIASGRETKGDMTTLEDISVMAKLRADDE
jgi:acetyl-CoA synthetase